MAHDDHGDTTLEDLHQDSVHAIPLQIAYFQDYLKENKVVFVNFLALWCIWCQIMTSSNQRHFLYNAEETSKSTQKLDSDRNRSRVTDSLRDDEKPTGSNDDSDKPTSPNDDEKSIYSSGTGLSLSSTWSFASTTTSTGRRHRGAGKSRKTLSD